MWGLPVGQSTQLGAVDVHPLEWRVLAAEQQELTHDCWLIAAEAVLSWAVHSLPRVLWNIFLYNMSVICGGRASMWGGKPASLFVHFSHIFVGLSHIFVSVNCMSMDRDQGSVTWALGSFQTA
ncbi:unnamed protein product [Ostreobium quekettii]|uniref:Uncharacterized protein n=1 Tax=Ostreobium quekettii TaxID=121088 RepID=A0A8S1IXJ2_9CHLO|nr:unnamed protein product [Ostreobium quekettii]